MKLRFPKVRNWQAHYTALASVIVIQAFLILVPLDPGTTPAWLQQILTILRKVNGVQIAAVVAYWVQLHLLRTQRERAAMPNAHWSLIVMHEACRAWIIGAAVIAYCVHM